MNRFLCIHGHFYQPPRENPWIEAVEVQDSASPYHDWNERVLSECYAPNALSRILDDHGRIDHIVNNYSNLSFDFGPTLLSWLEISAEAVYQAVLMADWESQQRFSGHGSAMAQAYNHVIMPLANPRDKATQVIWGLRDFVSRFDRSAEGMWLPETAVDLQTLDLLSLYGVRFVLLAPHQALRVRKKDRSEWEDVQGGKIDISRPYEVELPSGRIMAVFFYHQPLSLAVSFQGLLSNGDTFARRLLDAFSPAGADPQLVSVATDGEAYGHHHRFGDMALAFALHKVEKGGQAVLTNFGEFLEKNSPQWRVEIAENTSWSCAHGVERWRSDCGCATGQHPDWNQAWRAPLRQALDALRDDLIPLYEKGGGELLRDAWLARNDYIDIILDRSLDAQRRFFRDHAVRELTEAEQIRALKLLEMQRHAMLMFTSCGWFFDDLAGIEATQNLQYAGRAVQLAQELFGDALEERFLAALEKARSNTPESWSGRDLYEQNVRPSMVDLPKVAAHYAVSSLFESYGDRTRIYCYLAEREKYQTHEAGRTKLAIGRVRITSGITRESARFCYSVLHFGDQNISGGVRPFQDETQYESLAKELAELFLRGEFPEVIRFFDRHFPGMQYSLKNLFRDEQRKILKIVINENLAEAEGVYSQLYEDHAPLMRFLTSLKIPLPSAFQAAAAVAINGQLRRAIEAPTLNIEHINSLFEQARSAKIELETEALAFTLTHAIDRLAGEFYTDSADPTALRSLLEAVTLARSIPFWVDLWKVQNVYYGILQETFPKIRQQAAEGGESKKKWTQWFLDLGEKLQVRTEEPGSA